MKNKLIILFSFLCFLILFWISHSSADPTPGNLSDHSRNLSNHPVYSSYKFEVNNHVINLGTQPLYLPTNLITETMKRDRVLRRKLSGIGMEIHWYIFLKGHDVNVFLKKGNLHGGVGGDMPAITASATMDVVIPSMMQYGFTSIIARHSLLVDDLKGKRIGYAYGSNAHFMLLETLSDYEIDVGEVSLIPMEVTDMTEALESGKVDAFAAWEPTPFSAMRNVKGSSVIRRTLSTGYIYFSRRFSVEHPEAVALIIASEVRAMTWLRGDRSNLLKAAAWASEAGTALTGKSALLSPGQVAELSIKDILGITSTPVISEEILKENGAIHREFMFLKSIRKVPPENGWKRVRRSFDRKIIRGILTDKENYSIENFDYEMERKNDKE